ncbi:hypothetical protein HOS57_gp27 [Streptomyces phage AbbeyMikolon]|uniref:Uncharacterized protein n=1 Tax=Streptomyces phage AbbeyMikolon TaxID=2059880 RepID=A0A2H5BL91_9CAUD|nr:hypothetical protein HOS57_gp27 [Streptomyces phage AbbeyMikolon]AUG87099.1 hypothetical protein SEA_ABBEYMIKOLON_27 [Streptomyces phage AbbeyMikolon]
MSGRESAAETSGPAPWEWTLVEGGVYTHGARSSGETYCGDAPGFPLRRALPSCPTCRDAVVVLCAICGTPTPGREVNEYAHAFMCQSHTPAELDAWLETLPEDLQGTTETGGYPGPFPGL